MNLAEVVDALRILPRFLLLSYGYYVYHITWKTLNWYMSLPAAERTLEASGLAAGIVTAITGMGSWFLKVYISSGRNWSARDDKPTT